MRARGLVVPVLAASLVAWPGTASAQSCRADPNVWHFLQACGRELTSGDPTTLARALERAYGELRSPETLNGALGRMEGRAPGGALLRDLDLHFATVQAGEAQTLAVRYDWSRSVVRTPHVQGTSHWGWDLRAKAQGLLTADADDNPEDLLETVAYPHGFWSWGGSVDSATVAGQIASVQDSLFAWQAFDRDVPPGLDGLMASLWDGLSTQIYLTVGPEGRLEASQDMDRRYWALGGTVGLDVKAWNPDSPVAKLNVFDWPAALLRWLTGVDGRVRPSGAAIPTVLVSGHWVAADADPRRETLDGLDPFGRWSVEVSYRSRVAAASGGPVWLEMSYRHHAELEPSAAVREAELHAYDRFKVGLFGPGGFAAWWATGRLPHDPDDTDHYGVGFRLRF